MAPRKYNKRVGDAIAPTQTKKPRGAHRQTAASQRSVETLETNSKPESIDPKPPMNQAVIILDPDNISIIRMIRRAGRDFPCFLDGDVYIKLGEEKQYCYQLHSSVLGRASPWFRKNLHDKPAEVDVELARTVTKQSRISIRYELSLNDDFSMGHLVRVSLTTLKGQESNIPAPVPRSYMSLKTRANGMFSKNPFPTSEAKDSSQMHCQFDGTTDDGDTQDRNIIIGLGIESDAKSESAEKAADIKAPTEVNIVTSEQGAKRERTSDDEAKNTIIYPLEMDDASCGDTKSKTVDPTEEPDISHASPKPAVLAREGDIITIKVEDTVAAIEPEIRSRSTQAKAVTHVEAEVKDLTSTLEPQDYCLNVPLKPFIQQHDGQKVETEYVLVNLERQCVSQSSASKSYVKDEYDEYPKLVATAATAKFQADPKTAATELPMDLETVQKAKLGSIELKAESIVVKLETFEEVEPRDIISPHDQQIGDKSVPIEPVKKQEDDKTLSLDSFTAVPEIQAKSNLVDLDAKTHEIADDIYRIDQIFQPTQTGTSKLTESFEEHKVADQSECNCTANPAENIASDYTELHNPSEVMDEATQQDTDASQFQTDLSGPALLLEQYNSAAQIAPTSAIAFLEEDAREASIFYDLGTKQGETAQENALMMEEFSQPPQATVSELKLSLGEHTDANQSQFTSSTTQLQEDALKTSLPHYFAAKQDEPTEEDALNASVAAMPLEILSDPDQMLEKLAGVGQSKPIGIAASSKEDPRKSPRLHNSDAEICKTVQEDDAMLDQKAQTLLDTLPEPSTQIGKLKCAAERQAFGHNALPQRNAQMEELENAAEKQKSDYNIADLDHHGFAIVTIPESENQNISSKGTKSVAKTMGTDNHGSASDPTYATGPSEDLIQAYNNLFLTYYARDPVIDITDIEVALEQIELLVTVAGIYDSLAAVRPHINSRLLAFGRELYQAIARNPPRWVKLSILIASPTIYKEGILHIAGNYPTWNSRLTQQAELGTKTINLIEKKAAELESLMSSIHKALFMTSIRIDGEEVLLSSADASTRNTWFVVQVWRDWYAHLLSKALNDKNQTKSTIVQLYHTIAQGGDVYLPLDEVLELLTAFRPTEHYVGADIKEIARDLRLMKEFAQELVKPLCVDNSMLNTEQEKIGYFTCTKLDDLEMSQLEAFS